MAIDGGEADARGPAGRPVETATQLRRESRVLAAVLLGLPAVLTVVTLGSLLITHLQHPEKRVGVALLIFVVAIVLMWAVSLLILRRWRSQSTASRARLAGADRGARRRVYRALLRGEPIADADRPLAAATVQSSREQSLPAVLFPAISVIAALTAVLGFVQVHRGQGSLGIALMQTALAVVWALVGFRLRRDRRRIAASAAAQQITDDEIGAEPSAG